MEDKLSIDKIADEFIGKYGISPERTEYLLDVAKFRLMVKHPWKYLFQEQRQITEAYQLINRYLGMEKARNDKHDIVHINYERNRRRDSGKAVIF